jgi:diketogulonate reductase-like aldo/keto reductase
MQHLLRKRRRETERPTAVVAYRNSDTALHEMMMTSASKETSVALRLRLFIPLTRLLLLQVLLLLTGQQFHLCESLSSSSSSNSSNNEISRRNAAKQVVLSTTAAIITATSSTINNVVANAATTSSSSSSTLLPIAPILLADYYENENPPPILSIPIPMSTSVMTAATASTTTTTMPTSASSTNVNFLNIPRVGYSLYKTPIDQVERCTEIALRSGIYHIDVATQYSSNVEVGKAIHKYLKDGRDKLCVEKEKPELIELMDQSYQYYYYQTKRNMNMNEDGNGNNGNGKSNGNNGNGIRGRISRREELFLSHKLSNDEQSIYPNQIKDSIKNTMKTLGVDYLDMVSIHSSLTDKERRLTTYKTLIELQQQNQHNSQNSQNQNQNTAIVRSIGVCNYGVSALKEIQDAGLPLPQINQLELSPFNQHKDVCEFCTKNGIAIGCSAWSKLSGLDGPQKGWNILSDLASSKNVTKAQLMIKWSIQSGYVCVPRSSSKSKLERLAIIENSYGGVNILKTTNGNNNGNNNNNNNINNDNININNTPPFILSKTDMNILNKLDISYKAGILGRRDGWTYVTVTVTTRVPENNVKLYVLFCFVFVFVSFRSTVLDELFTRVLVYASICYHSFTL